MRVSGWVGGVLTAALLTACGAGQENPADNGSVEATPASLVWVMSQLLDAEPLDVDVSQDADSIRGSMSPTTTSTLRIGLRRLDKSSPLPASCSDLEAPQQCAEVDGAIVTWDLEEPEEDPGLIDIALPKGDSVAYLSYNGEPITRNPVEMLTLPYSVKRLVAVLKDPRIDWLTTQKAVMAGSALTSAGEESTELTPQALVHLFADATGNTTREATGETRTEDGELWIEAGLWTDSDEYALIKVHQTSSATAYANQSACDERFVKTGMVGEELYAFDDCQRRHGTVIYFNEPTAATAPGNLEMVLAKNGDTIVELDYYGLPTTYKLGKLNPDLSLAAFAELLKDPRVALVTTAEVIAAAEGIELSEDIPDAPGWIY
ncbi:MAG: hypothetical protein V9G04_11905 [Nocardioides sp.]|jgi:hypothetical protein